MASAPQPTSDHAVTADWPASPEVADWPEAPDGTTTPAAPDGANWPASPGYAVVDTPIGPCGIAWGPDGITGVHLPEASPQAMREVLAAAHPDAAQADTPEADAPPPVRRAVERIRLVLAGTSADDLADIRLDMTRLSGFLQRAYAVARTIRPGQTLTYGQVAARVGNPGLARAVGRAMGANPFPIIVPCHRVLGADGTIGGFSAPGGAVTKRRMLLAEGVPEHEGPALFGADVLYPADREPRVAPPRSPHRHGSV